MKHQQQVCECKCVLVCVCVCVKRTEKAQSNIKFKRYSLLTTSAAPFNDLKIKVDRNTRRLESSVLSCLGINTLSATLSLLTDSIQGSSGYRAEVSINLDSKDNEREREREERGNLLMFFLKDHQSQQ